MTLPAEFRRRLVVSAEGACLGLVQTRSPEEAAECVRLQVDGFLNALIRLEGVEAAAAYAFALSDRVAGGLREPTALVLPVAATPAAEPDETAPVPVATPAPAPRRRGYVWGVLHGAVLVGFIWLLRGHG